MSKFLTAFVGTKTLKRKIAFEVLLLILEVSFSLRWMISVLPKIFKFLFWKIFHKSFIKFKLQKNSYHTIIIIIIRSFENSKWKNNPESHS